MSNELLNQKKTKFGVYEAALATLLFVVFNFVFMEGFAYLVYNVGVTDLGVLLAQFLVEALFGLAAVATAFFCKTNIIKAAGMNKKVSLMMFVYSALIAFCSLIFFASLTSSFLELLTLLGYKSSASSMDVSTFGKYIGYVIAACVTPAVCEELLFRGTIQAGLKKYGRWISIISASFIFMLMHGGPEQTIHQFIIGVVVGLIFYETGNVWLGIIVHFFNNFISITELYLFNIMFSSTLEDAAQESTEVVETITASEAWSQFAINLVVALIMAAIGFLLIRYLIKKLIKENEMVNGEQTNSANKPATEQAILVDGEEVITDVSISEDLQKTEETELLEESKADQKAEEKKPMDAKTIVLFALPIAWMIFEWLLALISGF